MQRWFNSPPEEDPVPVPTVAAAAAAAAVAQEAASQRRQRKRGLDFDDVFQTDASLHQPAKHLSQAYSPKPLHDQGYDSISLSGVSSAASAASNTSQISHKSWKGRRGRKRVKLQEVQTDAQSLNRKLAPYQCTWCREVFSRRDTWKRHEESEHCPQKENVCMLNGSAHRLNYSFYDYGNEPSAIVAWQTRCAFCPVTNPDDAHLQTHNALTCYAKDIADRSFARLDGLVQHIKLKHNVHVNKSMIRHWERPLQSPDQAKWQCWFCQQILED